MAVHIITMRGYLLQYGFCYVTFAGHYNTIVGHYITMGGHYNTIGGQ